MMITGVEGLIAAAVRANSAANGCRNERCASRAVAPDWSAGFAFYLARYAPLLTSARAHGKPG